MSHLVLIYGTLKQFPEHRNFEEYLSTSNYLGEVVTKHGYTMLDFNSVSNPGKYSPGVVTDTRYRPTFPIYGELYEVNDDTIARLDKLEQVGINYDRDLVEIQSGQTVSMYLKRCNHGGSANSRRIIKKNNASSWHDPMPK